MEKDLFLQKFLELPTAERIAITELLAQYPGLFSYLREKFYQKYNALKERDALAIEKILQQEQEKIEEILKETKNGAEK